MRNGILYVKKARLKIPKSVRVELSLARTNTYVEQILTDDRWLINFIKTDEYQDVKRIGEISLKGEFEPLAKIPENCKLRFKIINRIKKQIEITGVIYEKHQI